MTKHDFLSVVGDGSVHCAMCGTANWDGCWIGADMVGLCRACALENLAGLFLDAVWCEAWKDVPDAEEPLRAFETRFYRAVALAFAKRAKP